MHSGKKNKFQSKSDVIPKASLQQVRDLCKTDINTFYVAIFGKAHACASTEKKDSRNDALQQAKINFLLLGVTKHIIISLRS